MTIYLSTHSLPLSTCGACANDMHVHLWLDRLVLLNLINEACIWNLVMIDRNSKETKSISCWYQAGESNNGVAILTFKRSNINCLIYIQYLHCCYHCHVNLTVLWPTFYNKDDLYVLLILTRSLLYIIRTYRIFHV